MQQLICRPSAACMQALAAEAWSKYPLETGGLLLGTTSRTTITVAAVVGPGPGASHERQAFDPDQGFHEGVAARLWKAHRGGIHYLGDWHTHPGTGRPRPSKTDRAAALIIAQSPGAYAPNPMMLLVGLESTGRMSPRAYRFDGHRLAKLGLVVDE